MKYIKIYINQIFLLLRNIYWKKLHLRKKSFHLQFNQILVNSTLLFINGLLLFQEEYVIFDLPASIAILFYGIFIKTHRFFLWFLCVGTLFAESYTRQDKNDNPYELLQSCYKATATTKITSAVHSFQCQKCAETVESLPRQADM